MSDMPVGGLRHNAASSFFSAIRLNTLSEAPAESWARVAMHRLRRVRGRSSWTCCALQQRGHTNRHLTC